MNKEEKQLESYRKELKDRGYKLSQAKRARNLLVKQKKFMGTLKKITPLEQPIAFLARRSGKVEIFENATAGKWMITHSDGKSRYIELRPSDQETFDYFGETFRGYQCHEDRPFAGFENPVVDSEYMKKGFDAVKLTRDKYEAGLLKQKNRRIWAWFLGAALAISIIVIAFALALMFVPESALEKIFGGSQPAPAANPPSLGIMLPLLGFGKSLYKQRFLLRYGEV